MKKVRLTEKDLMRIVKKVIKENISFSSDDGHVWEPPKDYTDPNDKGQRYAIGQKRINYMFFQNLKQIQENINELLNLDQRVIDKMLSNGHDWAADHIATSKDDIEEVVNFFKNEIKK